MRPRTVSVGGMAEPACYIGCQGWAHPPWIGRFFTAGAKREELLPQYAAVFGAAEGNTSFYALPPEDSVARWAVEAPACFRFCFKFPRTISHELRLAGAEAETAAFFRRVDPLGARLGPFFLQLHESFSSADLPVLERYLRSLPKDFQYAVEVRHADFFDRIGQEPVIDRLLGDLGMDRVNFDTTVLLASKANDEVTREAKRRKPRSPQRMTATGPRPFVRYVGEMEVERNRRPLEDWAARVARWIAEGRRPYFFAHHPDDTYAPDIARLFQAKLHELRPEVPAPAEWPGEREARARGEQLGLF